VVLSFVKVDVEKIVLMCLIEERSLRYPVVASSTGS
jgi:hypothetical protein